MELLTGLITLIFLGNYGNEDITGVFGFAVALSNVFGNGLSYGICTGLETLCSHVFGAKDLKLIGIYFNKTLVL